MQHVREDAGVGDGRQLLRRSAQPGRHASCQAIVGAAIAPATAAGSGRAGVWPPHELHGGACLQRVLQRVVDAVQHNGGVARQRCHGRSLCRVTERVELHGDARAHAKECQQKLVALCHLCQRGTNIRICFVVLDPAAADKFKLPV